MNIEIISQDEIDPELLQTFYSCWESFFQDDYKNNYLGDLSYPIGYLGLQKNNILSLHEDFYYFPESNLCPSELRSISDYLFLNLKKIALNFIETRKQWHWLKSENLKFLMRVLYYHQEKDELLNYPHYDKSYFTILPKPTHEGMQYLHNAEWVNVNYQDHEILILSGEKSALYLNAVLHRVISAKTQGKRLALAFFVS